MKQTKSRSAFTVVELMVIIAVIGILATISIVGWRGWQSSLAKNAVKSDLKQASTAMDNARNFNDAGYPTALPSSYKVSPGVTVTYVSGDADEYCIQGQSTSDSTVVFFINSAQSKEPQAGTCSSGSISTPTVATATVNGSTASLTWGAVSGATTYELHKKESTAGSWDALVSTTSTSYAFNGLQLGTTYNFQVRAVGSGGSSSWSATTSRVTVPTPTGLGVTGLVCGNDGGTSSWKNGTLSWTATANSMAPTYRITSTVNQPGVSFNVTNPHTSGGGMSTAASSSSWSPNGDGGGSFTVRGIGPNGEMSATATWNTPIYPPFEC